MKIIESFIVLLISMGYVNGQKSNESFLKDFIKNVDLSYIHTPEIDSFDFKFVVDTFDIGRCYASYFPSRDFGIEPQYLFYKKLVSVKPQTIMIKKTFKLSRLIKKYNIPFNDNRKLKLNMSSPLYYENKYYVIFKIEKIDSDNLGSIRYFWTFIYGEKGNLLEMKSNYVKS
jgi:hypothetical protein